MLDNILNVVKSTVLDKLSSGNLVPADKQALTVETAAHALTDGIKQNISMDNISDIAGLFTGKSSSTSNPVIGNISSNVVSQLVQKVGLSSGVANTITSAIMPAVLGAISGKIKDPKDEGFNLNSVIEAFTGGNTHQGGILSSLGKLFGGH